MIGIGLGISPCVLAAPNAPLTTLYHVIITGQSNGTGADAPVYTGPANGLMFNGGLRPGGDTSIMTSLVQLQDALTDDASGDVGDEGQTVASTLVNFLSAQNIPHAQFMVSNVAVDGYGYLGLCQGTQPYNDSLTQVAQAKALATARGWKYAVLGVCAVHGEDDDAIGSAGGPPGWYATDLQTWQSDYQTDIQAITGQETDIPLFISQCSTPGDYAHSDNLDYSTSINGWQASRANSLVIMASPSAPIVDMFRSPHWNSASYMILGEYFGKAIWRVVLQSSSIWKGVYPTNATLTGDTIVINFAAQVGPLAFDYSTGIKSLIAGFEYVDSTSSAAVLSASLTGPLQVTVTLTATPSGSSPQIRYSTLSSNDVPYGSDKRLQSGVCLVDSDTTPSSTGEWTLRNYCPAFYFDL